MKLQIESDTWKRVGFPVSRHEEGEKVTDRQKKKRKEYADTVGLELIHTCGTFMDVLLMFKVQPLLCCHFSL